VPIVLVRHAQPEIDPAQPPALWPLSDAGRTAVRALARDPTWRGMRRVFTSPELQAQETAHILAGANGLTVTVVEELREVQRPHGVADDSRAIAAWFARPHEPPAGWEPADTALTRIRACIERLRALEPEPFAVTGHGLALSLYVAGLSGEDPAALWRSLRMPDLAVVDPARGTVLRPFGRSEDKNASQTG
jgi:broad specificity phosphatase PhoE